MDNLAQRRVPCNLRARSSCVTKYSPPKAAYPTNSQRRFDNFDNAGDILFAQFRLDLEERASARWPHADQSLITAIADKALQISRQDGEMANRPDEALERAMLAKVRHRFLLEDAVMDELAASLDLERLEDNPSLYQTVWGHLQDIARAVARELEQPGLNMKAVGRPKRRRPWPPQVGWGK